MRPYNNESEKYLKDKLSFWKNFKFVSRGWLYVPEASYEEFDTFVHKVSCGCAEATVFQLGECV